MTHCSENGFVFAERFRRFAKFEEVFKVEDHKAWMEAHVLKKKNPMKSTDFSTYVPRVLCAMADQNHANILLNRCLAYSFASMLHTLFDAPSGPTVVTQLSLLLVPHTFGGPFSKPTCLILYTFMHAFKKLIFKSLVFK